MKSSTTYNVSFRCFYDTDGGEQKYSTHIQRLSLREIPKWIDAYRFTHPCCQSISFKVWFNSEAVAAFA